MFCTNIHFRMQIDIEHFRSKLAKIDGAGVLGDKLLQLVQTKSVAAPMFDSEQPEPVNDKQEENGSSSAQS